MTELRTMKDMPSHRSELAESLWCVETKLLREEAIKHVKELRKQFEGHQGKPRCYDFCPKEEPQHKIDWIIMFFNLTEEDLKEPCDEC